MRFVAVMGFLTSLPAFAGTINAQGNVRSLPNASAILDGGHLGTADWSAYCTNGQQANTYAEQGLTIHYGNLQQIRPGLENQGVVARMSCRPNPGNYFPNPQNGGAGAAHNVWFCPVGTFSQTVNQVGLTAGSNGTQYLVAYNAEGRIIGQVQWVPNRDSSFIGLETDEPIAMFLYCNDNAMAGATISHGGSTVMSDTLIWGNSSNCGNGQVDAEDGEDCDDGNRNNDDDCPNSCLNRECGNEHIDTDETCDDGNEVDNDSCLNNCTIAACGDAVLRTDLQAGEEGFEACDDADEVNENACTNTCALAVCGDGIVRLDVGQGEGGFESCDDGDEVDNNGCTDACLPARCGDGVRRADVGPDDAGFEACDDGNEIDEDACLNLCRIAACGDGVMRNDLA
ncbi:MAG: hypothetical protein OSB21_09725, partial [Myxococcota bacterium]|nr:hypothetical protein [Myxococcota bacterium]